MNFPLHGGYYEVVESAHTKEGAVNYLHCVKARIQKERESEAAAKERSKKSGVVYEDVI